MTTDELRNKLKKIDPYIALGTDHNNKPKFIFYVDEASNSYVLYSFKDSNFYHLNFAGEVLDNDKFNRLIRLVFKFKYDSKDNQTIPNDSKKENSSTMLSKKIVSKDSQKKTNEKFNVNKEVGAMLAEMRSPEEIKMNFIKFLLDKGYNPNIRTKMCKIDRIEVIDPTLMLVCVIDFSDKDNPILLKDSGKKDAEYLQQSIGLYANILQMFDELNDYKKIEQLKEGKKDE